LCQLSFGESELEGLDQDFLVDDLLDENWGELQLRRLVAAVFVWQQRGQWQRFPIALCCEGVGVFEKLSAEALRKKWRELVRAQVRPAVSLQNQYKAHLREELDEAEKVGEGLYMCRALNASFTLEATVGILERLLEEVTGVEQLRTGKRESVLRWKKPWGYVDSDVVKLTVLLDVAVAIGLSKSGFFSLPSAHAFAAQTYAEMGARYPFKGKPASLLNCLLRYLPVISVTVTEDSSVTQICARPLESGSFIRQFATLATQLQAKSQEARNRARELPMRKYLQLPVLSHKKDKRVVKGLMAHVTVRSSSSRSLDGGRRE
jgi:hypothetical protein